MKLVVDTSILIDHLRGGDTWLDCLNRVKEDATLYIPTIVIFELFSGKSTARPDVAKRIRDVLNQFQRVELTEAIAHRAGELYRDITHTLGVPDYIIAATALDIGADVVTLNRKHFTKVPGLRIYDFD